MKTAITYHYRHSGSEEKREQNNGTGGLHVGDMERLSSPKIASSSAGISHKWAVENIESKGKEWLLETQFNKHRSAMDHSYAVYAQRQ